jgi:hypothetical protein
MSDSLTSPVPGFEAIRRLGGHEREVYLVRKRGEQPPRRYLLACFELGEIDAETFELEVAHCAAIEHPGIAKPVEMLFAGDQVVLVLEGTSGASLERLLDQLANEQEALSDGAALHLGLCLCEALHAAHTARDAEGATVPLIHAQLGFHQLFVAWDGSVALLGVGLSLLFRLAAGLAMLPPSAEPYVAPEVRGGGMLTVRANVYSAAAMLWSLLVQEPFYGDQVESLQVRRPDLDPKLTAAIDQALDPSLVTRRITPAALANAIAASGLPSRDELVAYMHWLRSFEQLDDSTVGPESFPPARLSEAPPASVPQLLSLPPDSGELDRLVLEPISPAVAPRLSHPYLQQPQPAPPPRRRPPPPKKR